MTNAVIKIDHLTKRFGKLIAVNDIDLSVEKGDIFGFLGPNGSGKSTAIRCMMGFNKPSAGEIHILDKKVGLTTPSVLKDIGYLPGNIQLYDRWTGKEHFKFFEGARGKSKNLPELVKRLDFDSSIKFRYLSSGNKQKLGLILALMHEPKVLIMDEPTLGLDPLLQNEIHVMLKELSQKGVTVFISSHNLAEVEKICNQVGIIKEGKLVVVERVDSMKTRKIHHVVAHFVHKVPPRAFAMPGVEIVSISNNTMQMKVSGDLNHLIRTLASHPLVDVEIRHASLEDIFMHYYEKSCEC